MNIIDFMKRKKTTSAFSLALIIASFVSFFTVGFNFGIDFKGGVITEVQFEKSTEPDLISDLFKNDFREITAFNSGSTKNVEIQTPLEGDYKNAGEFIFEKIKQQPEYANAILLKTEFIGPKVGEELKTSGILALTIVLLAVLLYTSIRFEVKFATGAVLALIHDILITAGFISIFQIDVDLNVLAAMLAILGYSLNDTIVVYDRIRENFQKLEKEGVYDIINISLSETFSRTIMTSLTTAVTLVSILLFAGEALHSFAIVLLFGIVIGTYSSIYVASNSLLMLGVNKQQFKKEKVDTKNGVI